MSKSRKRRQRVRKLARSQSLRNPSARSLRYEPLEDRRMLAVVTVTTDQDVVDFSDGLTSLREAIFATNLIEGTDEIRFDFGHDGPATILLTQGELRITDSLTITGSGAELLTIDASGNDPTPEKNNGDGSRIFNVLPTVTGLEFSLLGLTLTGGDVALGLGGAILAPSPADLVRVVDSVIQDNAAFIGGGIYSNFLEVTRSQLLRNHAGGSGGAIIGGEMIILDSVFANNRTENSGGAIRYGGRATVIGSEFFQNYAGRNGGAIEGFGDLSIESSLFQSNQAAKEGGAINQSGGVFDISLSTVSGNRAGLDGGGINASSSRLKIFFTTITNNTAKGTGGGVEYGRNLVLDSTILAGNFAASNNDLSGGFFPRPLTLQYSFIGDISGLGLAEAPIGSPDANGNLIGGPVHGVIDAMLGVLADNGGPTLTHALLPGSPAINAGDLNAVAGENNIPLYDQRGEGFDRILSRIDIGAYEVQELGDLNLLVDTLVDESDSDYSRGDLSLREAIELANANPVPDTIRFDPIFAAIAGPLPATILLTMGELAITDSVEIVGLGAELLTIDGGNGADGIFGTKDGFRLLNVTDGTSREINVALSGLTFTGGDVGQSDLRGQGGAIHNFETLSVTDSTLNGNSAVRGGGISSFGTALITNSTLSGNLANGGGGIHNGGTTTIIGSTISDNTATSGGGIYNGIRGNLAVNDTTIAGNAANGGRGGGLFNTWAAEITGSTILDNTAMYGGGIFSNQGGQDQILEVNSSTISENSAKSGGGIFTEGIANIINSTLSNNTATEEGGGIFNRQETNVASSTVSGNSSRQGGGIFNDGLLDVTRSTISGNRVRLGNGGGIYNNERANITNSTISGNTAAFGSGGGILNDGLATIAYSTITKNSVTGEGGGILNEDLVTLVNSLVAENAAVSSGVDVFSPNNNISSTFSLIGNGSGQRGIADGIDGNQVGTSDNPIDLLLGPLASNGGPTQTHALLLGSPAINAGDPQASGIPEFDQRGNPFTRISDSRIDIGAYESQPLPGDFDEDGDSDGEDLAQWQGDFGLNGNSDSDSDGDSDGADFLNWQRTFGVELSEIVSPSVGGPTVQPLVDDADDSSLRIAAIDLAIAAEHLSAMSSIGRPSIVEPEFVLALAQQPTLEQTRPVHRTTVRSAYRLVEISAADEDLPAELDDELSALDELFAVL